MQSIVKWSNASPIQSHGKKGFTCYFCEEPFEMAATLKEHTLETHERNLQNLHLKHTLQWTIRLDVTSLKCAICDKGLSNLEELLLHLETHDIVVHLDIQNQIIPYSFPQNKFYCAACDKEFAHFKPLTEHLIQHYKIYECSECGKGFLSKKNLTRHINRHGAGGFKCNFCGKEFSNRELVLNHERLVHKRGDGRVKHIVYECLVCQKKFKNEQKISVHVRRIHLKEKRYHCEVCDQGFFLKNELEHHMVMHTKEKNYKCHLCPKAYARRRGLVEHLRVHADDKRFRCEVCGKKFIYAQVMKIHMKTLHEVIV